MQTNGGVYDPGFLMWHYMSAMYPGGKAPHPQTPDFPLLHPALVASQLPFHPYCGSSLPSTPIPGPAIKDGSNSNDLTPQQQAHRRFLHHPRHSTPHQHPGGGSHGLHHQLGTPKPKKSAFTIDAILHGGEVKKEAKDRVSPSPSPFSSSASPIQHLQQATHDAYLAMPRLPGLLDPTHPYYDTGKPVTPIATATAAKSAQKAASDKKSGSKGKRVRTIFTPEQLERLEAEFERQQYMVGTERYYLAVSLNLTEAQVKVWFQNRRIKWRKQTLEQQHARLASLYASHSPSDSDDDDDDSADERDDERREPPVTSSLSSASLLPPPPALCSSSVTTASTPAVSSYSVNGSVNGSVSVSDSASVQGSSLSDSDPSCGSARTSFLNPP